MGLRRIAVQSREIYALVDMAGHQGLSKSAAADWTFLKTGLLQPPDDTVGCPIFQYTRMIETAMVILLHLETQTVWHRRLTFGPVVRCFLRERGDRSFAAAD